MGKVYVAPKKSSVLKDLFHVEKPIIGMVHLLPLPGAPSYEAGGWSKLIDNAVRDAISLREGGVDGLMVENFMDRPFMKPDDVGSETVACMAVAATEARKASGLPIGISCLANAVTQAFSIALASGARWVRANEWANAYIADEGFVEAAAPKALRHRSHLRADHISVFADVMVKHGSHFIISDRALEEQVRDIEFFQADAVIVTGSRTGAEPRTEELKKVKAVANVPVIIGSGLTPDNALRLLGASDAGIVGTFFKREGHWWNPVELPRVRKFMRLVDGLRSGR